jgi:hypothetical protein
MRTRNLIVAALLMSISIVSLVLLILQDDSAPDEPLSNPITQTETQVHTPQPVGPGDLRTKTPEVPAATPPDLKAVTLDPNKPRPMPAYVDTMPSTPPPMPMEVPAMPSEPPPMPELVAPAAGEMPYDPSKYDPAKRETTAAASKAKTNPTTPSKKGVTPKEGNQVKSP